MWVVCINNGKCRGATSKSVSLTIGKKYLVSYVTNGSQRQFRLKNDIGNYCYYSPNRFISLVEYREDKIEKLIKHI
jgi:hypothetical protein